MQAANEISITLPMEMIRAIRSKVDDGEASDSEVVRKAVDAWMERERHIATLEAAVDRGIADAEAGRVSDSETVLQSLLKRISTNHEPPIA